LAPPLVYPPKVDHGRHTGYLLEPSFINHDSWLMGNLSTKSHSIGHLTTQVSTPLAVLEPSGLAEGIYPLARMQPQRILFFQRDIRYQIGCVLKAGDSRKGSRTHHKTQMLHRSLCASGQLHQATTVASIENQILNCGRMESNPNEVVVSIWLDQVRHSHDRRTGNLNGSMQNWWTCKEKMMLHQSISALGQWHQATYVAGTESRSLNCERMQSSPNELVVSAWPGQVRHSHDRRAGNLNGSRQIWRTCKVMLHQSICALGQWYQATFVICNESQHIWRTCKNDITKLNPSNSASGQWHQKCNVACSKYQLICHKWQESCSNELARHVWLSGPMHNSHDMRKRNRTGLAKNWKKCKRNTTLLNQSICVCGQWQCLCSPFYAICDNPNI